MSGYRAALAAMAMVAGVLCAPAAGAFTVEEIVVRGSQRIEEGTVRNYLPLTVGEELTPEASQRAIRALYDTGFFGDVRLLREDGTLIVEVDEKPVVSELTFSGMEQLEKEQVRKALRSFGLEERKMFSRSGLRRAVLELERQYHAQGFYSVKVDGDVQESGEGEVKVTFRIDEGEAARIAQVQFVGNERFSDAVLQQQVALTSRAAFSFLSGRDRYSRQQLRGDLESLRSYYMDRGHLRFRVESTQVQLSPNRRHIFITINMREGAKYRVSEVELAGNTVVPKEEIWPLVEIQEGELFSRSEVQGSVENISERIGDEGFAFANINPVPQVNEDDKTVALTLQMDPGRRVNVRRAEIRGNDRTQDRVVRREFRQMEGARYQTSKVERSKQRANQLGYFRDVNLETPSVEGSGGALDLDMSVTERSTGQFQVGAGFSDVEGLLFTGSIRQRNLFGTGQRLSLQANIGGVSQRLNLSYTEPFFTIDGVSLGGDVFYTRRDTDRLDIFRFTQDRQGFAPRMGFPLSEWWRDSIRLAFERTDTEAGTLGLDPGQEDQFLGIQEHVKLRNTLTYDSRDSPVFPRDGLFTELQTMVAVPPGDTRYFETSLETRAFFPLLDASTWTIGGELGRLQGFAGEDVPFYERFFVGGSQSVRGFDTYSLGPQDNDGDPKGGVTKVVGNTEVIFPIPGTEASTGFRWAFFADTGWVYGDGQSIDPSELRAAVGAGLRWRSPMGPLRFDFAFPVIKKSGDDTRLFNFTVGTSIGGR